MQNDGHMDNLHRQSTTPHCKVITWWPQEGKKNEQRNKQQNKRGGGAEKQVVVIFFSKYFEVPTMNDV